MTLFRKNKSKSDVHQEYQCTVRFLDDSEPIQVSFTKDTVGQFVLDKVCDTLNLVEKDYFGLRYVDSEKQRHWLDPTKTIYKQLKGVSPCVLCFRVKFYPADPMKLREEITRYYLFLQLRRDLHHGRLLCSPQDANLLAAYIIQSEVGDYDPQDHAPGYVSEFKMLPKQNIKMEEQIQDTHKTITGQVPAEAEGNFLKKASSLDTYGVDPHQVKDQKGTPLYLGVTHQGIMTFHGSRRTQLYKWPQIKKLAFEGKMFIAHVNVNEDEDQPNQKKKHQPIGYKCTTVAACKYLWKCAVEQQFFFTLNTSMNAPKLRSGGSLFSRGSRFRFSGRCQNEAYQASEDIKRKEPDFQRTSSLPALSRKSPDSRYHLRNAHSPGSPADAPNWKPYNAKASTLPRDTTMTSASVEHKKDPEKRKSREFPKSREALVKESENIVQSEAPIVKSEAPVVKTEVSKVETEIIASYDHEPHTYEGYEAGKEADVPKVDKSPKLKEADVLSAMMVCETGATVQQPESPVDVPGHQTAEVPASPVVMIPVQEGQAVVEEIQQVQSGNLQATYPGSKQNGVIPIIVTPANDDTVEEGHNLSYDPDVSEYGQEDDAIAAKSLEDQIVELEKEYERKTEEQNNISATVQEVEASKGVKLESQQEIKAAAKKGGCSCVKVFAMTFFSVFLTLAVGVCVVMFSDIQHPIMNELRTHLHFLEPTRDYILDKYNSVFQKS